jgi:hypothetical protein
VPGRKGRSRKGVSRAKVGHVSSRISRRSQRQCSAYLLTSFLGYRRGLAVGSPLAGPLCAPKLPPILALEARQQHWGQSASCSLPRHLGEKALRMTAWPSAIRRKRETDRRVGRAMNGVAQSWISGSGTGQKLSNLAEDPRI